MAPRRCALTRPSELLRLLMLGLVPLWTFGLSSAYLRMLSHVSMWNTVTWNNFVLDFPRAFAWPINENNHGVLTFNSCHWVLLLYAPKTAPWMEHVPLGRLPLLPQLTAPLRCLGLFNKRGLGRRLEKTQNEFEGISVIDVIDQGFTRAHSSRIVLPVQNDLRWSDWGVRLLLYPSAETTAKQYFQFMTSLWSVDWVVPLVRLLNTSAYLINSPPIFCDVSIWINDNHLHQLQYSFILYVNFNQRFDFVTLR